MNLKGLPCFQHVQWNPGPTELRSFARAMLIGFAVIGLLAAWRQDGFGTVTYTLWGSGAILAVAALMPVVGKFAHLLVYVVTGILGFVISRIILTAVFFLLFTPLGLLLKALGKDFLHTRRSSSGTEWIAHAPMSDRQSFYRRF